LLDEIGIVDFNMYAGTQVDTLLNTEGYNTIDKAWIATVLYYWLQGDDLNDNVSFLYSSYDAYKQDFLYGRVPPVLTLVCYSLLVLHLIQLLSQV